jgi:CBS-domain-containing membrane protein
MRRCGIIISSPLAAAAVILLLVAGCFHCAAAARLLPSSVPVPAMVHHGTTSLSAPILRS